MLSTYNYSAFKNLSKTTLGKI